MPAEGRRARLRRWARELKTKLRTLHLASRHPRTPWYARALAFVVVGYALSPIDLIPDPIPILGYLDDLILLPLGVWLTWRLVPADVWAECEAAAREGGDLPRSRVAAGVVVLLWLVALALAARLLWPFLRPRE